MAPVKPIGTEDFSPAQKPAQAPPNQNPAPSAPEPKPSSEPKPAGA